MLGLCDDALDVGVVYLQDATLSKIYIYNSFIGYVLAVQLNESVMHNTRTDPPPQREFATWSSNVGVGPVTALQGLRAVQ